MGFSNFRYGSASQAGATNMDKVLKATPKERYNVLSEVGCDGLTIGQLKRIAQDLFNHTIKNTTKKQSAFDLLLNMIYQDGYTKSFQNQAVVKLQDSVVATMPSEPLLKLLKSMSDREGLDFYRVVAAEMYRKALTEVTLDERAIAKHMVFRFLYDGPEEKPNEQC